MSIALLPFGRAVEIPTALLALSGCGLLFSQGIRRVLICDTCRLYTLLFILLWLPMVVSVIGSEDSARSLEKSLLYLRFLFAGLAVLYLLKKPEAQEAILYGGAFIVAIWMADSILQLINGVDILGIPYDGRRLSGPFHKLIMPVFLTLLLPFCLYAMAKYKNLLVFICYCVVVFLVLLFTGSRASLMVSLFGLSLFCGFALLHDFKKRISLVLLAFTLSLSVVGLCYIGSEGFQQRVDSTAKIFNGDYDSINTATSNRLPIWQAAWRVGINKPINGVGLRNFRDVFHAYKLDADAFDRHQVTHAHLFFLETFAETGFVGLLGLIIMPLILFRFLLHQQKPICKLPCQQVVAIITIMLAFFPFNSHVALYGSAYSQLAWLMTAISCSFLVIAKPDKRAGL